MGHQLPLHFGPRGVELFSGCGGLSTGFVDAGFRVAAGFEAEPRAVAAFDYNHAHRGGRGIRADVLALCGDDVRALAGLGRVDFVVGGPPCQPFSDSGKRLGLDDPRSLCVWKFAELAVALDPSFVVMENVAPILRYGVVGRLEETFARAGYRTVHGVLDAADFGVPQTRRRFVLLAARDVAVPTLPAPTHGRARGSPHATVAGALAGLPDAEDFGACGVHNHEPPYHSDAMVATFAGLGPGDRDPASKHARLRPNGTSFTLRAGSGNFTPLRPVHPALDRVVTVRESARLHGYADDFVWPDSIPRLHQYRQVGNSVPPPFARAIAAHAAKLLGIALSPSKDVAPGREDAVTMTDGERRALRARRTRARPPTREAA